MVFTGHQIKSRGNNSLAGNCQKLVIFCARFVRANLEGLDAGIEATWRCAWLVVDAGVVALMLAFHGVAALSVVVAQFVVNGAMFLFLFQALSGRWSLPAPELEAVMMVTVSAVARLRRQIGRAHV